MTIRTALTCLALFCSLGAAGAQDAPPVRLSMDAIVQSHNFSPIRKFAAVCGPAGCCSNQRCAQHYGCENNRNGQSTCTVQ